MVEKIQTLLALLGIIGVLAVVAERVNFPFPILLVIAGLLIALFPGLPEVKLDPELVFLIFLPPLLFSAAWNFPWEDFRSNFLPIFALAVGLVFATIVCVAYAAHWLIPGMTLATGFVLGAIVSPPDAVAVTVVLKNVLTKTRHDGCHGKLVPPGPLASLTGFRLDVRWRRLLGSDRPVCPSTQPVTRSTVGDAPRYALHCLSAG
jgi:NhaP-type Na+/H+ or K+/H+ antiporter